MSLQFAPVAGFALRYGMVALATYGALRYAQPGRRNQHVEDAMDETPEGLTFRRDDAQVQATGRWRRVIRFGRRGPGVDVDATGFARIKVRRLK